MARLFRCNATGGPASLKCFVECVGINWTRFSPTSKSRTLKTFSKKMMLFDGGGPVSMFYREIKNANIFSCFIILFNELSLVPWGKVDSSGFSASSFSNESTHPLVEWGVLHSSTLKVHRSGFLLFSWFVRYLTPYSFSASYLTLLLISTALMNITHRSLFTFSWKKFLLPKKRKMDDTLADNISHLDCRRRRRQQRRFQVYSLLSDHLP